MVKTQRLQRIFINLILAAVCLLIFIPPLYIVIVNSLKSQSQASSMGIDLPTHLHWENFLQVINEGNLVKTFFNSLIYSTFSTVIGVLLAAMAAYVFSRNKTKFNKFMYFFIIMGIALPINYVTLTKVMQMSHLINTHIGIILLYAANQIPFSVFITYGFVGSVPKELDEAAVIDGCNAGKLFFKIIFPLLTPVLATTAVLNFMGAWNEFLTPLYYLNDSSLWPMTLAVYNFFGQYNTNWNLVSADILLTCLPVVVIFLLGQRFILSGLTSGSVKG